jgi:hypothetical protein
MRRKAEDGVYPTRPALGYVNVTASRGERAGNEQKS